MGSRKTLFTLLAHVAVTVVVGTAPAASAGSGRAEGWVVDRVRFEPLDPPAAGMTVEGVGSYRGVIELRRSGTGLAVINEVALEDYVRGISEVPANWPAAALQAQAIAARTFAMNQMANGAATQARGAGADICATDACQVYRGLAAERRDNGARWSEAVDATAGQVLLANDKPIVAKYSSSNGGRSVSGGARYLPSVDDPDDARSPLHRWTYSRPLADIAAALGIDPPSRLVGIDRRGDSVILALQDGPAPPPDTSPPDTSPPDTSPPDPEAPLQIVPPPPPPMRTEQSVPAAGFVATMNSRLGAPAGLPLPLPSWQFTLETDGPYAVIHGRGHGHGIGMSQYGALGKAARGQSASDIVASYYGGIRPTTLPPDRLPAAIRVAVTFDQAAATVSDTHYFRVVDGAGNVLAPVALGHWRVTPADGGVRVVPPAGHNAPLEITTPAVEPSVPAPADITVVRFAISAPAIVTVMFNPPGTEPGANPARVVDAGEVVEPLPSPATAGDYEVVVHADAGPGRQVVAPLTFRAAGPPVPAHGAAPPAVDARPTHVLLAGVAPAPAYPSMAGLATLLLMLTAAASASVVISVRNRQCFRDSRPGRVERVPGHLFSSRGARRGRPAPPSQPPIP